jgi:ABC-2 type transport system ATP-binding protein
VLLSTHLLAEVEETCSRVLILSRGRVAAQGTVAEVARLAAAPRSARVRVAPDSVESAVAALNGAHEVERAPFDGQHGWLTVTLRSEGGRAGEESLNDVLRELLARDVPVLSFELEGARLSDAFLAMTEAL